MEYYSQLGQDRFLNTTYFKNKKQGVFCEVGANDGVQKSNSLFFEKLGWAGICIEPLPQAFNALQKNRKCICENFAINLEEGESEFLEINGYAEMLSGLVNEYSPEHLDRVKGEINHYGGYSKTIKVKTTKLQTLFDKHNIENIDYLSIDTEGNELKVLETIDYKKTNIFAITIENNYQINNFRLFLESKGFEFVRKIEVIDEVYINKNFYANS